MVILILHIKMAAHLPKYNNIAHIAVMGIILKPIILSTSLII